MGPTAMAETNGVANTTDNKKKSNSIRRLLTPAIFTVGDVQKHKINNGNNNKHEPPTARHKTIIETAFVNNSNAAAYGRIPQYQQRQQTQRAADVTDFRSRSVSPGSFDRDVNANLYGQRRIDSTCSLQSAISEDSRQSGRRSAPIIPYSQYYNNRAADNRLLMPVSAQVKISVPPQPSNVVRQHPVHTVYGNIPATTPQSNNHFVRGSPQRATIGCVRESPSRQSTIYEEDDDNNGVRRSDEKRFQPIFKRGTLQPELPSPTAVNSVPASPKRVSFSPQPTGQPSEPIYWPTKKGLSPQPPTRSRSSGTDSSTNVIERPLPPVPRRSPSTAVYGTVRNQQQQQQRWWPPQYQQSAGSESGSEAGEIQRIMNSTPKNGIVFGEDDWSDSKTKGSTEQPGDELRRGRSAKRDDPRRHTLSGDQHHNYQPALTRSMDLEMGTKMQRKKSPASRGAYPPTTGMLFDDDPGIMSEVETSSTGFRRGNKQRSSLPVVRTPSKTLERPLGFPVLNEEMEFHNVVVTYPRQSLGLVFLQYRSETKRALLPNEITSIDTVKALFVRSFPKQLTMEYMDSALVKIYIHDSSKDMFYELEDLRSHLNDIRDRSVLRLFESAEGGSLPQGLTVAAPTWDQDQSYFSEPEFDSEYQHQHIHKTKGSKITSGGVPGQPYYMTHQFPPGTSATLPNRGRPPTGSIPARTYSPAVPSSAVNKPSGYMSSPERAGSRTGYTVPPYMSPGGSSFDENSYYGYGPRTGSITPVIDEETRLRVENMERQIANLTGLVQKALVHGPVVAQPFRSEKDRFKPQPPPKSSGVPEKYDNRHLYSDLQLTPEMYNQLRVLQKKAKDLRQEARNLRRMSQAQAHTIRETIKDTFIKIRALIASGANQAWNESGSKERALVDREEDIYKQEIIRLETDLTELESTVEELRGNVINKKSRVNMSDVENMALVLSKSSKTVAELKMRFPSLQESIRNVLTKEMDRALSEEKFLKEEPDRLESALKRCKKLTGTLVTLKRLASVQEQRLPDPRVSPTNEDTPPITPTSSAKGSVVDQDGPGTATTVGIGKRESAGAENALNTLLDELQTTSAAETAASTLPRPVLRRLSSTSSDAKPPVPERTPDLQNKRMPPPPPPRTSSKSPVASPTTGVIPTTSPRGSLSSTASGSPPSRKGSLASVSTTTSSSSGGGGGSGKLPLPEPVANSGPSRQEQLEQRHQELLKKQKALQEQYMRLQQLQRSQLPPDLLQLKKTGSEGNLLVKMGLAMSAAAPMSGSLTQLASQSSVDTDKNDTTSTVTGGQQPAASAAATANTSTTTSINKVYETDII
ncbi:uncharacterized protein LOC126902897 isoform X13 [Daktulosphaira vitifoliae]|uniref:uncharacterized protein LOC126902897 isoform X13 n=1 Tax=Daktulosphaira vitifoliae TaxID=58002 RepID=UPI0021AA2D59|nr:uncharacterized protein LOC126902897 isoform X13 [Daktulosphaira vitifoliae]